MLRYLLANKRKSVKAVQCMVKFENRAPRPLPHESGHF